MRNEMDRIVEKKVGNKWVEIDFEDLRKGDIFRMWEDDEKKEPCIDKDGKTEFIATSDPKEIEGIWKIEVKS